MTSKQLIASFEAWRKQDAPLVLAWVYDTEGSTYSKAGAQMLINAEGDFQGMLSGGCLEGDLAERAHKVLKTGVGQTVTYDLGQDDEELWGLGVGCDGLMRIFLTPLTPERDYQPFTTIAGILEGDVAEVAATVLQSADDGIEPGMSLVTGGDGSAWSDMPDQARAQLLSESLAVREGGQSQCKTLKMAGGDAQVLFSLLRPPPRVLILGGGLDARPLLQLTVELGWRATLQDHRPAYIEAGDFADAEEVLCVPAAELATSVNLARFDAVVVMSHHLATDRQYLELLAATDIGYIGLLGPPHRRSRLLDDLGDLAGRLAGRLHGPAGLEIGGSGPESIALSIVAEMHAALFSAPGGETQAKL